jgi:hypothetical protein
MPVTRPTRVGFAVTEAGIFPASHCPNYMRNCSPCLVVLTTNLEEYPMPKQHASFQDEEDFDEYAEQFEEQAGFERIRSNTNKPQSIKTDRRQQDKAFGKAINKHLRDHPKLRNRKP